MPSLLRLIAVIALVAGAIYGGLYALANYVHPHPRPMSASVPSSQFAKKP